MTFTLIDLSDSLFVSVTFIIVDLFKLKKALYNLSKINALVYVEIFLFLHWAPKIRDNVQ